MNEIVFRRRGLDVVADWRDTARFGDFFGIFFDIRLSIRKKYYEMVFIADMVEVEEIGEKEIWMNGSPRK